MLLTLLLIGAAFFRRPRTLHPPLSFCYAVLMGGAPITKTTVALRAVCTQAIVRYRASDHKRNTELTSRLQGTTSVDAKQLPYSTCTAFLCTAAECIPTRVHFQQPACDAHTHARPRSGTRTIVLPRKTKRDRHLCRGVTSRQTII